MDGCAWVGGYRTTRLSRCELHAPDGLSRVKLRAIRIGKEFLNVPIDFDLPHDYEPLPYESRLSERDVRDIDLVVIHCTELPDLKMAREYGERVLYEDKQTGASGHLYVDRDGSVRMWVDLARIANHTRGYNPRSIGIEIVNTGRFPNWYDSRHQAMTEPYSDAQINAVIAILRALRKVLPNLQWMAGHEDLDRARVSASDDATQTVARKLDPGPQFPWVRVETEVPLKRLTPKDESRHMRSTPDRSD